MNNEELAKLIAHTIDEVQQCQGVQQEHELEGIILEILSKHNKV